MDEVGKLQMEFTRKFGVVLSDRVAVDSINRIGIDRCLDILSRIRKDAGNPIGYFRRSVANEPISPEPFPLPDDEPSIPDEYEHPSVSKEEFRRWYFRRYPETQDIDSPDHRRHDLENFSDLTRYRAMYIRLRSRILAGDTDVLDDPIFTRLQAALSGFFPPQVFASLHPVARCAALYGYLVALEERGAELDFDADEIPFDISTGGDR